MRYRLTPIETSTELTERRYSPLRKLNCLSKASFEFLGEYLLGGRHRVATRLEAVERVSLHTFFVVKEKYGSIIKI
jgi:hypothetical protein